MNKKATQTIVTFAALGLIAAQAGTTPKPLAEKQTQKPNLLFVFTDQQSFDMMGSTNPHVQTPHLDALAEKGVRFDHAISNQPICTPYRGMLLSGQHPLYNGCLQNDLPLLSNTEDRFAHVLGRNGYETAYIGKWHLYGGGDRDVGIPPGPNRQGFDEVFLSNNCTVDFRGDVCFYFDDDGKKVFFKEVYSDKPWELEAQTRQAEEWFGRRDRKRPFALFVSWHPPHDFVGDGCDEIPGRQYNYDVGVLDPELLKPYEGQEIRLRPGTPIDPAMENCRQKQYRNYMAMITACDAAVGRLIDKLKKQGVYDNTLIVFTSDHGDMLGSHGATIPKLYPHDYSVRIPLIMHWPDHVPAGKTSQLLVGAMDIMPTVLGLMNLPIPETVQGVDISRAVVNGDDDAVAYQPIFMYPFKGGWRGVFTRDWTYSRSVDGETRCLGVENHVLYDRTNDPGQLNNLFGNPEYADVQAEMERLTQQWMKRFGDREYKWADFVAAGKKAGIPLTKNYSHRPIDLLNSCEE